MKNYVLLTIHSLWGKALTLVVKNNIHRTQILSSSLTSVHALNKKKIFIINVNINLISCSMYLMFYSHLSKAFCNFGWFLLSHLLNISNVKMIMLLSVNTGKDLNVKNWKKQDLYIKCGWRRRHQFFCCRPALRWTCIYSLWELRIEPLDIYKW